MKKRAWIIAVIAIVVSIVLLYSIVGRKEFVKLISKQDSSAVFLKYAILLAEQIPGDNPTRCGYSDLIAMYDILRSREFSPNEIESIFIQTRKTSRYDPGKKFLNSLRKLSLQKPSIEFLVIYYSGHGGQEKDLSNPKDEEDGWDEVLHMGGSNIVDDTIKVYLQKFKNTKIVFITDCCSSESNMQFYDNEEMLSDFDLKYPELLHLASARDNRKTSCKRRKGNGFLTLQIKKILTENPKISYKEMCKKLRENGLICNSYYSDIEELPFINDKFLKR